MENVQRYSWLQFDKDVTEMVRRLRKTRKRFDGVWGPPRGGLPLAVMLSHALEIPFLLKSQSRRTLIVDDIADTGKSLRPFFGKNFIVTVFYHHQSLTVPDIWMREKRKKWIIFPWEKTRT